MLDSTARDGHICSVWLSNEGLKMALDGQMSTIDTSIGLNGDYTTEYIVAPAIAAGPAGAI